MFVSPMFLNSKATLLDIMCIKISGRLPWGKIINGYGTRKPLRPICGESFKRERSGWECSSYYFKVLNLRSFMWGDYKM